MAETEEILDVRLGETQLPEKWPLLEDRRWNQDFKI
jgi:hypothetical protein